MVYDPRSQPTFRRGEGVAVSSKDGRASVPHSMIGTLVTDETTS